MEKQLLHKLSPLFMGLLARNCNSIEAFNTHTYFNVPVVVPSMSVTTLVARNCRRWASEMPPGKVCLDT